jgi:CRISPR-associated protein Cas1
MKDLHELPKLRDSLSYLYVEQSVLDRRGHAVEFFNKEGAVLIPAASLCVLMLGPGTSITHAAICILAENGCTVLWIGQEGTRFYAQGTGETRKAHHVLRQAELASDPAKRAQVVVRMYRKRFGDELDPSLTLPQIRGMEGVRVREAYAQASLKYGVRWEGRRYDRQDWGKADPVNRALSAANAVLNGVCHAAIVSGGYSTAIGFIHTGKQLSFVYDIADLYKAMLTIPIAFETAAKFPGAVESNARALCRERFRENRLLERILPDIDELLGIEDSSMDQIEDVDQDAALPNDLWAPLMGRERERVP